jgi:hypothetical protein
MQVVDRMTSSGYSYVSPSLKKACNAVPLLNAVSHRIETYASPLIKNVDMCIDTVYDVIDARTTALRSVAESAGTKALDAKDIAISAIGERTAILRDVVSSRVCNVQQVARESAAFARVHKTSFAIVDTLDLLIDQYLPEPEIEDGKEKACESAQIDLIPKMLYLPFKIPVRMMRLTVTRTQHGCDAIRVQIRWGCELTSQQKSNLQAFIFSKSQAATEKVSSSSMAVAICQGKQDMLNLLQVAIQSINGGCCVVRDKLHVTEVGDRTLKTARALPPAAMNCVSEIFLVASSHVRDATSSVVGQEPAKHIFASISKKLPFVNGSMQSSAFICLH